MPIRSICQLHSNNGNRTCAALNLIFVKNALPIFIPLWNQKFKDMKSASSVMPKLTIPQYLQESYIIV